MGKKSGFTSAEIEEIKRLYLQEGRSILQIPKILGKGMQRGKVTPDVMAKTLNAITPTLEYSAIKDADLVIEAVVENPKVKDAVLRETEDAVREDTILTSNTSTISNISNTSTRSSSRYGADANFICSIWSERAQKEVIGRRERERDRQRERETERERERERERPHPLTG